ncbi:MAG: malto-oligosyltrehalose trehalohydrolase [Isosphaeraceae bacterium]
MESTAVADRQGARERQWSPRRRLPVGAEVQQGGGVHFRVWAPRCQKVEVVIEPSGGNGQRNALALEREEGGYFSGFMAEAGEGTLYRYRLDDGESYPDPASRFQPQGVHGPSQVVDPGRFPWSDRDWKGLKIEGQVIYELHLGTFSEAASWAGATSHLPRLAELGVTCVEVMPVAEFAGSFGWGYDGVDLYAPYHGYGSPEDMRRFIDHAHSLGLGVILDVVYNHFGPDGCYHHAYSASYVHSERGGTDWGDALNFDGPECGPSREYFLSNPAYWISEYHLDGLRLDATHAIKDASDEHLLLALSRVAREAAGERSIILIAENESQNVRLVRSPDQGGYGLDANWNDDFHHAARVAMTGHAEAYYCDYRGTPQELISAVKWGYLFQGQLCKWQQKLRGSPTLGIPAKRFVTYLENHDQVANSARGFRVKELTSPGRYRAMTTFWLLSPQTPMLFQGQELGSSRPFVYFSDHKDPLGSLVREGRKQELSGFRRTTHPELDPYLPDASSRDSYLSSKLEDPGDYSRNPTFLLFRDLLKLRREDPVFRLQHSDRIHGAVLGPEAFAVRFLGEENDDRLIVVNLGRDLYPTSNSEPLLAPPPEKQWSSLWFSEHPRYGGSGIPPYEPEQPWILPGHCALVLAAVPAPPRPEEPAMGSMPGEDYDVHPAIRSKRQVG